MLLIMDSAELTKTCPSAFHLKALVHFYTGPLTCCVLSHRVILNNRHCSVTSSEGSIEMAPPMTRKELKLPLI